MNWDEVGAIGQVLGSVAVFVTLGYLAVQVSTRGERCGVRSAKAVRKPFANSAMTQCNQRAIDQSALRKAQRGARRRDPVPFVAALMERRADARRGGRDSGLEQLAWWHYRTQVIRTWTNCPRGERTQFDVRLRASSMERPGCAALVRT